MRISDYHGEEALDLFADLMFPASEILADKEVVSLARSGQVFRSVQKAIKGHKKEVIEILARIEGVEPDEYAKTLNPFTLPKVVLENLNDAQENGLVDGLFPLRGQKIESGTSGSAMANTTADEN